MSTMQVLAPLSRHHAAQHLGFLEQIMMENGCPGKGKGPWDGLGATIKRCLRELTGGKAADPGASST